MFEVSRQDVSVLLLEQKCPRQGSGLHVLRARTNLSSVRGGFYCNFFPYQSCSVRSLRGHRYESALLFTLLLLH